MKTKMKIVALVLVLAVALTGAGYAAWGNTITATTSLNTGTWEVVLENDVEGHSIFAGDEVNYVRMGTTNTIVDTLSDGNYGPNATDADVKDPDKIAKAAPGAGNSNYVYTIKPEFDPNDPYSVEFAFYNLHPGTKANTTYEIRNKGSIPAKIQDVRVTYFNGGNEITNLDSLRDGSDDFEKLFNAMEVSGQLEKHWQSYGPSDGTLTGGAAEHDTLYGITPEPFDCDLYDLESALEAILVDDDFQLLPQEDNSLATLDSDELEIHNFKFEIPIDSLDGDDGEASSLRVVVEYDFVQYNVMVE